MEEAARHHEACPEAARQAARQAALAIAASEAREAARRRQEEEAEEDDDSLWLTAQVLYWRTPPRPLYQVLSSGGMCQARPWTALYYK